MAQGDTSAFNGFLLDVYDGNHDFETDAFKWALITTLPLATQTTPTLGDFTEVSGTGYTAGGESATITRAQATGTLSISQANTILWAKNAAGPTNIVAAILYNTSSADRAMMFIDMTTDGGTTPVSMQDGQISIAPPAGNVIYDSALQ